MIPYVYFTFLGFYFIFTFFYVNDFNNPTDSGPHYVSFLINNDNNSKSYQNLSPHSAHEKLTNSEILKKFSEFDVDSNDRSPLQIDRKSDDFDKYKNQDQIREYEIYEIQEINVLESMEFIRNGKLSRVKNLI